MSDCTYTFKGADGKEQKITGLSAFKSFLANGGLEQLRGIGEKYGEKNNSGRSSTMGNRRAKEQSDQESGENSTYQNGAKFSRASDAIKSAFGGVRSAFSTQALTDEILPESRADDIIYSLQDKHVDLRRVVQAITKKTGEIADNINAYLQEELFHGRSAKGVKDFLDFELKPLINDMRMRGVEMADFEEYLWNRHAEERNKQIAKINDDMPDGGSGIKTAEARAYLDGLAPAKRKAYEALAAKVDAINKKSQQVLVDSGLEKQSTIDAWNGAYQSYVPLHREDVDSGHVGTGKGYSIRGSSSKRAVGSGKAVVDILGNIAMQRETNIVRAEKNRVSNAFLGLAKANPDSTLWKVDDAPKERVVETRGGKDTVVERIVPGFRQRDNVVMTRIDGEDHYVILNERNPRAVRLAMAFKNLDANQMGNVLSAASKVTRYLSSINTQYNPIFGLFNVTRDTEGAMLNLSTTPLHGQQKKVLGYTLSAIKGIYSDLRARRDGKAASSEWASHFEEFQNAGGATGYRDQYNNAEARAEAIKKEIGAIDKNVVSKGAGALFDWLSDYNEAMENAVRLASFRAAKEMGMSTDKAASLAKNLTVNFNRKGQVATQVGALYAFFNASVQGTARLAETMAGPLGKKILYGGMLLGVSQAVLLAAAGYDDDEPPEFIKERSLIIPIGDGKYATIPMPLGFHVIPNLGRIPAEYALSGFKNGGKRVADIFGLLADTFNPIGNAGFSLQTIAPSMIDPFVAIAENKDWNGKAIYKADQNSQDPSPGYLRAKDTASPWSKAISYGLNILSGGTDYKHGMFSPTPDQIDYLIGQATGGVGREISKATQTVGAMSSGEDLPLYKVPLVGRIIGDTEGKTAESNRFYESIKRLNGHEREMKGLIQDRRIDELREYREENPEYSLVESANQVERKIQHLTKLKRAALKADDTARVEALEEAIANQMQGFNARVKALSEE